MKAYKQLNFSSKLLVNYPLAWSLKLHYIIPISLIFNIFFINLKLEIYQIESLHIPISFLSSSLLIYLFYTQKNYILSQNYEKNKVTLEPFFRFQLYIITMFFILLPTYSLQLKVKDITKQYHFTQEEHSIKYFYFTDNKYKTKCKFNDINKTYSYGEGEKVCIGNKELFNNIVLSLTSLKSVSEIETKNIYEAMETMEYIENIENVIDTEGMGIYLLLLSSFLLIIFQNIGIKKFIFILLFLPVSYFFLIFIEKTLLINSFIEKMNLSELLTIILLTFLYKIINKKYKIIYFIISILWLFLYIAGTIQSNQPNITLLESTYFYSIISILIIPIVNHIIYLQSKPKDIK